MNLIYEDADSIEFLIIISEKNAKELERRAVELKQKLHDCTINVTNLKRVNKFVIDLFTDTKKVTCNCDGACCPNCNNGLCGVENYCMNCGQKLNWSERSIY